MSMPTLFAMLYAHSILYAAPNNRERKRGRCSARAGDRAEGAEGGGRGRVTPAGVSIPNAESLEASQPEYNGETAKRLYVCLLVCQ